MWPQSGFVSEGVGKLVVSRVGTYKEPRVPYEAQAEVRIPDSFVWVGGGSETPDGLPAAGQTKVEPLFFG